MCALFEELVQRTQSGGAISSITLFLSDAEIEVVMNCGSGYRACIDKGLIIWYLDVFILL